MKRLEFERKAPTKPGWYWCRNTGDKPGVVWEAIVRIDALKSGELFAAWMKAPGETGTMCASLFSYIAEWAGPIQPPP